MNSATKIKNKPVLVQRNQNEKIVICDLVEKYNFSQSQWPVRLDCKKGIELIFEIG